MLTVTAQGADEVSEADIRAAVEHVLAEREASP
jgi:hypothetical protein